MLLWLDGAGGVEFENILLGANVEWSVNRAPSDMWGPLKRSLPYCVQLGLLPPTLHQGRSRQEAVTAMALSAVAQSHLGV